MTSPPLACPVCAALLLPGAVTTHVNWHEDTETLNGWAASSVERFVTDNARAVAALAGADDYPTAKLPPVRDRILPRPPAPEVRELRGAELLRALADEISRDLDAEDGTEDGPR